MRLNYDCIRDIMMAVSQLNTYTELSNGKTQLYSVPLSKIKKHSLIDGRYDIQDIQYSIIKLFELGYFRGTYDQHRIGELNWCNIDDITITGHQFLDSIQEDSTWEAVKKHAKKMGAITLKTLAKAADFALEHPECIQAIQNAAATIN